MACRAASPVPKRSQSDPLLVRGAGEAYRLSRAPPLSKNETQTQFFRVSTLLGIKVPEECPTAQPGAHTYLPLVQD